MKQENSDGFSEVVHKHDHPVAGPDYVCLQVYYRRYKASSEKHSFKYYLLEKHQKNCRLSVLNIWEKVALLWIY